MTHQDNRETRLYFLDNLRTFMIFLVVLYHAGLVYESSGISAYFWIVDDPSTTDAAGIVNIIVDIFIMSVVFYISGYFTPSSLRNKPGWTFLAGKFRRIMIPWLIAVFTLIPLYKMIFLYSRGMPQEHWTGYFYFSHSTGIFSQNWLWFLPVLFAFYLIYLIFSRINLRIPAMTVLRAVTMMFIIGLLYSLTIRWLHLEGWTKSPVLDFQNDRLLIYFMMFLLGALSYRVKLFHRPIASKKLYIVVCCFAWIPLNLYVWLVLFRFIRPGVPLISADIDRILLWTSFHLSLLSLLYLMVTTFRFYFNKPGGRLMGEMNRNSYSVYIIHMIVLGVIALLLLNLPIPSLVKYLVLTLATFAASNGLVSLYRRIIKPGIATRLLKQQA